MKFDKQFSDEGVSPVVGVILMVAITVILSAIIATFVLDLGGTVSQNPQAGVTFDEEDGQVSIQVISMENADSVEVQMTGLDASQTGDGLADGNNDPGASGNNPAQLVGSTDDSDTDGSDATEVGDIATVSSTGNDKITVTATLEGKTSVIQTYTATADT